ncbi:HD domain-containing protein [Bifidobacterium simiarum]|uniref:Phosphohydrolase n=1 Tax=Bifidobacterium simiarum TaxID=2045441 RepID=A0A2M9HD40_9BIFI|nr:HD domain-containing protein [Bifidobacterium simiarum]PJM74706.1 phosphohydrolase [Bifidobacterium simiarum]
MLTVLEYGLDIIESPGMQSEKRYFQHGNTTTFQHSVAVAERSVRLAHRFGLDDIVDMRSLVVAALLHDYFLYDWHDDEDWHRLHGFTHGRIACLNAIRDYGRDIVNDVVADSLINHMYPLTNVPPKYTEGWLVSISDKLCATGEAVNRERFRVRKSHRVISGLDSLPKVPSLGALRSVEAAVNNTNGIGSIRSGAYHTLLALRGR